ncbi:ribonuclease P protein component [bacterium (Candidatus Howlettbacteria) CG_4_10_14_0_8_um_filter_40_9]|nr:MAG: ribonuclease P protein component [bacterium (Candidatus Howlettbacteria) CG_4_10_14_0_8_um_filter_40_9]
MLKKQFRVTENRDFQIIYKKGKYGQEKNFKLNFLGNRRSFSRFTVVVSKKTEKSAVKRNRAKRVFREAIRAMFTEVKDGFDFIINIKKEGLTADLETIKKDIKEILLKNNLLK